MDWHRLGEHWPGHDQSHLITVRPHRWHVQDFGPQDAPTLLLLHGTGSTTHSWRGVIPGLTDSWRVIVPDLPGHGFTKLGALQRSSPRLMAEDIAALLEKLKVKPAAIVGHSAGFALASLLAETVGASALVGLAPALDDFKGAAGWLFPMMAKALAANPFVAPTVARFATEESTRRLIASTGSQIDDLGVACYRACLADTSHVDGTLTMMAQWQLRGVRAQLTELQHPILFLNGSRDEAIQPEGTEAWANRLPSAKAERLDGLGHLAHEEQAELVAKRILDFLSEALPDPAKRPADDGPSSPNSTTR